MSFYNTGNPVPSDDPRDLDDNAKHLDIAVNTLEETWVDRNGTTRKSLRGIEHGLQEMDDAFDAAQADRAEEFNEFLANTMYEVPVTYAPGLSITRATQTVIEAGIVYRPVVGALPFVTTTFSADAAKWAVLGDASLRQDLAEPSGSYMSGWERQPLATQIDTVGEMLDGQYVNVWEKAHLAIGYGVGSPSAWDWTPAFQAALDEAVRRPVYIPWAGFTYRITSTINIASNHCRLAGDGRGASINYEGAGFAFEYTNTSFTARHCYIADLNIYGTALADGAIRFVNMWESTFARLFISGFSRFVDRNDRYTGAAGIQIEAGPSIGSYWNTLDGCIFSDNHVSVRTIVNALGVNALNIIGGSMLGKVSSTQNPADHPGFSPAATTGLFYDGFGLVAGDRALNNEFSNGVHVLGAAFEKLKTGVDWQCRMSNLEACRFEKNNIHVQHNTSTFITTHGEGAADVDYDEVRVPNRPRSSDLGGRTGRKTISVPIESTASADIKTIALFSGISGFMGAKQIAYELQLTLEVETTDNGRPVGSSLGSYIQILRNGIFIDEFRVSVLESIDAPGYALKETATLSIPIITTTNNDSIEVRLRAEFSASKAKVNKGFIYLRELHTFDNTITVV